jgi:hypothetical protein
LEKVALKCDFEGYIFSLDPSSLSHTHTHTQRERERERERESERDIAVYLTSALKRATIWKEPPWNNS